MIRDTTSGNGDQPTTPPAQQSTDTLSNWPRLPDGVRVHDDVDLHADDPTWVDEIVHAGNDRNSHRRCVATKKNGSRCASRALHHHLLCLLHQGRMTAEGGARAKAAQAAERQFGSLLSDANGRSRMMFTFRLLKPSTAHPPRNPDQVVS